MYKGKCSTGHKGQHCSRSCCFLMGTCCQETTSVYMNTFFGPRGLVCFLKASPIYITQKKWKWITTCVYTNGRGKKESHLGVEISGGCRRVYHATAWKHWIEKPWLILLFSLKPSLNHFSIPSKWFMNNLISLPANHGGSLHNHRFPPPRAPNPYAGTHWGPTRPHLYFTSTVDCSPALSTLCLNQDCGRNITKRQAIHHQGCPGYEIQAGPLPTMSPILYVRPHACVFIT